MVILSIPKKEIPQLDIPLNTEHLMEKKKCVVFLNNVPKSTIYNIMWDLSVSSQEVLHVEKKLQTFSCVCPIY